MFVYVKILVFFFFFVAVAFLFLFLHSHKMMTIKTMDYFPYYDPAYSTKQQTYYLQDQQQSQQWLEQLFIPQTIISPPPSPLPEHSLLLSTPNDLSVMSQKVIRLLCCGNTIWDMDRITNFSSFCDRLMLQIDIPEAVVYTR